MCDSLVSYVKKSTDIRNPWCHRAQAPLLHLVLVLLLIFFSYMDLKLFTSLLVLLSGERCNICSSHLSLKLNISFSFFMETKKSLASPPKSFSFRSSPITLIVLSQFYSYFFLCFAFSFAQSVGYKVE